MSSPSNITRHAFRTTDNPSGPLLHTIEEDIPLPPPPNSVVIKVHAISLNFRDANIIHNSNPWPVLPHIIPCSDAAGFITHTGSNVTSWKIGDRVTPIVDQASITGREQHRIWLAADIDGVLAGYLVMDENVIVKIPDHLTYDEASILPCAGVTAWSALKGIDMGSTVLIQGTGGVSMLALKLAVARGCKVILTSSSDEKLARVKEAVNQQYPSSATLETVNYAKNKNWHEEVLHLTKGLGGVDLVLENGGTTSLVQSMKCTKRSGIISQVGYLGKQNPGDLTEMLSILIDRKINLRGINVGSKHDFEDLNAAIAATAMRFEDIIDRKFSFGDAEEAIEYVWQGKQVGKVVLQVEHGSGQEGGGAEGDRWCLMHCKI